MTVQVDRNRQDHFKVFEIKIKFFDHLGKVIRYYRERSILRRGVDSVVNMNQRCSDDDLVEQIRHGDEKAAEELIKRYYPSILRYCKNHCFHQEKAEDLTQETFLKLFQNLSRYKGKRRFKAYLYTIANHLCIDESRKTEVYSLEEEKEIEDENDEMGRIEDKSEIDSLLSVLSSEQREAVILRFGEELSFWEIARVMGCNMRTAQSRVRNALKIMRKEQENGRQ